MSPATDPSPTVGNPDHPLFLNLRDRRVVVVGAGMVGTRRALSLAEAGADVWVVAPDATADVQRRSFADPDRFTWIPRAFQETDLDGAWLVHTATADREVNAAVVAAADRRRIWSVDAGSAQSSPAWSAVPIAAEDGVRVAVSGGGDPRRARAVGAAITTGLGDGTIPLRRRRKPSPDGGRVTLVGAGPGDPELLTLRARRALRAADVVVADHLAPAALLADLEPDVEVRYAGKRPGHHSLTQAQINDLIVARAREGHRVVRLKGGDPFVLGRGGEEALACVDAGVPVEVVPGVTSAVSVPAAAGIPLTHRGITSSFVLASGHAGVPDLLRQADAAPADATLVLLMGTRSLAETAAALVARGRSGNTPVAIVERGWTADQRTLVGTLDDIADIAARAGVQSPAIVVVGEVVSLRSSLGDLARPSRGSGHTLPQHTLDGRDRTNSAGAGVPADATPSSSAVRTQPASPRPSARTSPAPMAVTNRPVGPAR